ncbi:MAG: Asp-tRNA(Asn)/Glu-tRNA(Gln) amidotransferase subunit GatA [bacterium]
MPRPLLVNNAYPSLRVRQELLRQGDLTLNQLVSDALKRAEENRELNAFITLTPELAYHQAYLIEEKIAWGDMPPLAGVILGVKDNIALKGYPLTCASRILKSYISPFTATALERLINAGAVVIGKTNLDEFAMGSSNENSAYGSVRNPHNPERVPGGSSGGSAAAVASGIVSSALGSDTGGSVRQPAAFCGTYGLKPTYGRVSRYGLVAFASSLDQIGVISGDLEELIAVWEVMSGPDPHDNTSSPLPVPHISEDDLSSVPPLRIGVPQEYKGESLSPAILRVIERAMESFRRWGWQIEECSLPHTHYGIAIYYIIAPAEASSNLARYDGVRYGLRASSPFGKDFIRETRGQGFGKEVKRRIMMGTYVLSSGYHEAYYLHAQKVRRLIREDFLRAFENFDLLLTPATPTTAFPLESKIEDPIAMYYSDIFTVNVNLAGIPALVIPAGKDEEGLPIGLQLIAPYFREDLLFKVAKRWEDDGE